MFNLLRAVWRIQGPEAPLRSRPRRLRRRDSGNLRDARRLRLEPMEERTLLSVAFPCYPIVYPGASGAPSVQIAPLSSSGPVGLTPAQVRAAFGIDQIKLNSIVGDGNGQTIAIVDAYDNPALVDSTDPNFINSNLYKFDHDPLINLPDPPSFLKLDEYGNPITASHHPPTDPAGTGYGTWGLGGIARRRVGPCDRPRRQYHPVRGQRSRRGNDGREPGPEHRRQDGGELSGCLRRIDELGLRGGQQRSCLQCDFHHAHGPSGRDVPGWQRRYGLPGHVSGPVA